MEFSFEVKPSLLKVVSALLVNISAGFLFLLLTTRDINVLTAIVVLVILSLSLSVKIEDIREEL